MRTRKIAVAAGGALAALLLLAGCSSQAASPVGDWGTEDGPNLTLAEDGALSGTDGCNRLVGEWEQEGDTIDFGQVGSTMMFCEGVDTWLNGLATATQDGDTLRIFDAGGAEIGSLERQ